MAKTCLVCGVPEATNEPDAICRICKIFDKEKVEAYKANNTVPEGTKPENTQKSTSYGMNWMDKPLTETRKEAIARARRRSKTRAWRQPKPSNWLSPAESKIADRLDALGESTEILKKLGREGRK